MIRLRFRMHLEFEYEVDPEWYPKDYTLERIMEAEKTMFSENWDNILNVIERQGIGAQPFIDIESVSSE